MTCLPTLVVVSGPAGAGKTTLAHKIAQAVGCPAVCRDQIKEGMMHTAPGFMPGPGDDLTRRTRPVFFDVLGLLLKAELCDAAEYAASHGAFERLSIDAPGIEVDTTDTDGYRPKLGQIVAFINAAGKEQF